MSGKEKDKSSLPHRSVAFTVYFYWIILGDSIPVAAGLFACGIRRLYD